MLGDDDTHRAYEDYAVRHVMGGLDEAEQGTFRSHLLDCAECRARVGELRTIASDLAEVERVERRERAAQVVETKQRADEVDEVEEEPPRRRWRSARLAIAGGLLLIVLLSVWNLVLRGQNDALQDVARTFAASAEAVTFGEPWDVEQVRPDHEGIARELDDRLAVMVRGTDDAGTYRVRFYDAAGDLLLTDDVASAERQIRWYGRLEDDAVRVDVAQARPGGEIVVLRALTP